MALTPKKITSKIPHRLPGLARRHQVELTAEDVAEARKYIKNYWPKLTRYHPKDDESLLGLPKPYLVPAFEEGHEFDFNELYYWDSYFMVQGMLDAEHKELVMGVLENLLYTYERFKVIPNASRTYLMGRSQPPFLSSFILDVHQAYNLDKKWLKQAIKTAESEYHTVWTGKTKPNTRLVYQGLSRYYDVNYLNDLAEAESGWDYTPRFNRRALNYLPVDLNSLLYKYERDFAYAERILGNNSEADKWEATSQDRRVTMNKLMWSELRGLYYDYNYVKESRGSVSSLAAYYPMWAGLADERQAAKLVNSLRKFERRGGLSTTDAPQVGTLVPGAMPAQWAYPNGWAPLHFIAVKGLQRYGYHNDARRIAMKWLKNNLDWFNKHGVFLEKYNVVQPDKPPAKGVYPSQTGFGWTNAVFERFCREFIDTSE
ncbi:MAG TPA: trehalase family glycosidase [Candidatus Saccharimonadales bacterium]|nr:trehalase family glycosidase [Candidatus Saccharimonadales bacterium]